MTTTGQRLAELAGTSGLSAGALLRLVGVGNTAAQRLVDRSGLQTGTALQHLLAERAAAAPYLGPQVWPGRRRKSRRKADEEALFALGIF